MKDGCQQQREFASKDLPEAERTFEGFPSRELARQLRFQGLVSELLSRFVNTDEAQLEPTIDDAIRRLAEFLGLDQVILVEWGDDPGRTVPAHSWTSPGCESLVATEGVPVPWVHAQTLSGKIVCAPDIEADLPPAAVKDKAFFQNAGIKGLLTVPLMVSRKVAGSLVLTWHNASRVRLDELIEPIRMVANVFAASLERKRTKVELIERLRFEALLRELSVRFINLPNELLDGALEEGQRRLCEFLGLERSSLFQQFEAGNGRLLLTHFYQTSQGTRRWDRIETRFDSTLSTKIYRTQKGSGTDPYEIVEANVLFPWTCAQLQAGRPVIITCLSELPDEAAADRKMFELVGTQSTVVMPLMSGGVLLGALSFASVSAPRRWPEVHLKQFESLAQVFAQALARHRADRALRRSEEFLRLATESAEMGLWSTDLETGRIWVTAQLRKLFGFGVEEQITRDHFEAATHPADREKVSEAVKTSIQTGAPLLVEHRVIAQNGGTRWIIARGGRLCDASGQPVRIIGTSVDITERKQAEETLRQKEEENRVTFDQAAVGIAHVDVNGRWLRVNDKLCAILRYPREELLRLRFQEITHPDDLNEDLELMRQLQLGKLKTCTLEKRYFRKDRTLVWANLTVTVVRDSGGEPKYFLSLVEDITERKQAESELDRIRVLLAEGQRIAHVGSWEFVNHTEETVWSDEEFRIYGLEPGIAPPSYPELLRNHFHPEDSALVDRVFRDALRAGAPWELEHRIVRPDGTIRTLYGVAQPEFDSSGRLVKYLGATLDITERKAAEERLRESEGRFVAMANSAPVLIWASGPDKLCTFFNEPWLKFTGRTLEQELGDGWSEGVHPDHRERCLKVYHESFESRTPFSIEYQLRRSDGQYRWISDHGVPRYDSRQNFVGFIGSCVDVTELKQGEAEVQRSRQELAHVGRLSTLAELAGSLAHELNQPLTSILSNAQAARRFLNADPVDLNELRSILEDIIEEDRRAGEVIVRIRGLLRKGDGWMLPVDLNKVIGDVQRLVHSELLVRRVKVVPHLALRLPPVRGDRIQLQQLILNLIMNSCEASDANGARNHKLVLQTEATDSGEVQVTISDNGPGFSQKMLEQPFEAFRTTKPQGLGLGLPICRSIVQAHGGRIVLGNTSEGGARVCFILPGCSKELP